MESSASNLRRHKILCVENDRDTCELITFIFAQEGYEVVSCEQENCIELLQNETFSAVILNNHHVGQSGVDLTRKVRNIDHLLPVIFFSGEARPAEIGKVMDAGADVYLIKPMDLDILLEKVIGLIER